MKKALQPQHKGVPQQPQMVVAAPHPTETEYKLLCLKPESGYPVGTLLDVYGCNVNAETFYVHGYTSKYRRIAADFEEYEHEMLFKPLPEFMAEINPKEYPGCFQLIITNANLVAMPEPYYEPEPECKVIQHPSTTEAFEAEWMFEFAKALKRLKRKAKKNKDPKQLYFTPELYPESNQQNISA